MARKIALSLMILLTMCGISNADLVYMTSSGHLGSIRINSSSDIESPSLHYTGNLSSPFLTTYWDGSSINVMMIDRNATASGDRAYIFPTNNIAECVYSTDLEGIYGTECASFSENGYSLFLGAEGNIYEVRSSSFYILNSFDCYGVISRDGYDTEVLSLAADSSYIHALASDGERQKYMRFDGQIRAGVDVFTSADLRPGASCMLTDSSGWPVIGHSSGIDMLRSDMTLYDTISTDHPVRSICPDSSNSFFYSTQYRDGDNYVNTVMHSAMGTQFTPVTIISSSPNFRLLRDNTHKETFAAMYDEGIRIISYVSGRTSSREYSASSLGGTPAGVAAAAVSGYSPNSSSSGCDSVQAGMILLAMIPLMLRRK
ncbi:MAG: hypothetical protein IJG37_09835 [Synergistaceae bacterium]|nr:hypothetical protein [Synergistaceae bacterium]MBQ7170526.1 hypothetical protein [Synergistaceae bacterium]